MLELRPRLVELIPGLDHAVAEEHRHSTLDDHTVPGLHLVCEFVARERAVRGLRLAEKVNQLFLNALPCAELP